MAAPARRLLGFKESAQPCAGASVAENREAKAAADLMRAAAELVALAAARAPAPDLSPYFLTADEAAAVLALSERPRTIRDLASHLRRCETTLGYLVRGLKARRVLVGVDGSDRLTPALPAFVEIARAVGATQNGV